MIGLLCLAVAGCTTKSEGTPAPASTNEVSTTDSAAPSSENGDDLPSHGAPKVEDPLDTTQFQQDPCSTLTTSQLQNELNLPPSGKEEKIAAGIGCTWSNPDTGGEVQIGFLTRKSGGLSDFYAGYERGELAYFTPLPPIEGYPAIAGDLEDRRPTGICIVNVGVTDKLTFHVVLYQSAANVGTRDPCEFAADIAGMALRTMKEGA